MINRRKNIDLILLIIWMAFIFIMSNQPANISDSQSGGVIKLLAMIGIDMNNMFGQLANFIVRKCAHFTEYMILALLVFNVLKSHFNIKQVIILTIICIFFYACSDEIHQLFVPGREGAFRDVLIDTCGGTLLTLIQLIKVKMLNRYRNIN
ncbi:VanZ family protein [Clostridium saccharobutylicum]|uniref:VanZ family protein n=1 Tax=Clostridium saccharobutylicum DSM 13864 TaxID=1345695 RepID=U5N0J6_CLOSA|nr:VanZ family protein [Clostridium saccharobutylicum]AGX45312.1 VanZ family protein [Clostridium saccharobutylicum DSM 13864]AQR92586.1 VanZ like family protein [Clostridium saccharobutylicum]AQS02488.1 VanZ like family protein [Clostridium saccharobutylicum]AQS12091.1 VanZ like family protein [Clostridium saccharobutylicum]AQS16471.1 VanZ like family protein [Clostridium saccharobutylicum]